jgi:hypothetical protein
MNNPMSRKLFQTREAREKLRGMGGILASSPELSQTVARFRDGMMVNATPFNQIAQRVPNMSQEEMVAAGMPSLGLPRREIVELFERVDPNIGPEEFAAMSRQERIAAGFSSLGALNEAYFAARARLLESQFPEQGPSMPPAPATLLPAENFINPADEFAGVTADPYQLPEMVIDSGVDTPPPADGTTGLDSGVDTPAPADGTTGFDFFPAEPIRPIRTAPPPAQTPPAETPPAPAPSETLDSTEKEVLDTEFKQLLDDDQRLAENEDPDPEDRETLAQRRIELYRRLFGEDEPTPRDKNMQLAMIGLAIAAGQSPDALTNIAQGALTGLQAISAEDSARRGRDRELRGSAISGLLSEQADARKETLAQRQERIERYNKGRQEIIVAALSDTTALAINDPAERYAYAERVAEQWARSNFPDLVGAPAAPAAVPRVPGQNFQEGDILDNPETGESVILRNNVWVPL